MLLKPNTSGKVKNEYCIDDADDLSKNEDCVDLVLTWLEGIIPLFFFKEFWLSLISFLPALLLYWIYFVVARIV